MDNGICIHQCNESRNSPDDGRNILLQRHNFADNAFIAGVKKISEKYRKDFAYVILCLQYS